MAKPALIAGGLAVDDRGALSFVNDFRFEGVRRFYVVRNYRAGLVRAWHGHRQEAKYVTALVGSAVVAAIEIDDWQHPSKDLEVHRFVLSAEKPAVLYIPPGYANGSMTLTADARLVYFSTVSLEESRQDDVRFDAYYWDPWAVQEH